MASGYIHDQFHRHLIMPTSLGIGSICYFLNGDINYSLQIVAVSYIAQQFNRWCTPDTDQVGKNFSDFLTTVFDPYFSKIWFYLWLPYAKLIPHRNILSHGILIGGIVRLWYFSLLIFPLLYITNTYGLILYYWDFTLIFVLSYCLADLYHILLDYTFLRQWAEKKFST